MVFRAIRSYASKKAEEEEEARRRAAEIEAIKRKIAELQQKRQAFVTAKTALTNLINNLIACESHLGTTYSEISAGISCADSAFTSGIDKINKYKNDIANKRAVLQDISSDIDYEIQLIDAEIQSLSSRL